MVCLARFNGYGIPRPLPMNQHADHLENIRKWLLIGPAKVAWARSPATTSLVLSKPFVFETFFTDDISENYVGRI